MNIRAAIGPCITILIISQIGVLLVAQSWGSSENGLKYSINYIINFAQQKYVQMTPDFL